MNKLTTHSISNRLVSMHAKVFAEQNTYMWSDSKKVADIIRAVEMGRSSNTRLSTADKILTKWGF